MTCTCMEHNLALKLYKCNYLPTVYADFGFRVLKTDNLNREYIVDMRICFIFQYTQ